MFVYVCVRTRLEGSALRQYARGTTWVTAKTSNDESSSLADDLKQQLSNTHYRLPWKSKSQKRKHQIERNLREREEVLQCGVVLMIRMRMRRRIPAACAFYAAALVAIGPKTSLV